MSRPKAAARVAASNVAASLAALLSPARAEASRRNGARSRGPVTPEGKVRSAQNALKHGLRAERFTVVGDEDEDAFDAHEAALLAELMPAGALQTMLVERIARAAWRLRRADCIEATLFDRLADSSDLGLALTRDGNGARAFDVLLRYRGAAQAELFRTLRTLKALQAEQAQERTPASLPERPYKPDARGNPGESARRTAAADEAAAAALAPLPVPTLRIAARVCATQPGEPESHTNPPDLGRSPFFPSQTARPNGSAALLAGTALVPIGRRNGD
jgi:hypothetical protein